MSRQISVRSKLIVAALSLLTVYSFYAFSKPGGYSAGELVLRIGSLIFWTLFVFGGIFGNAVLQLLWGSGLAIAGPALLVICCFGLIHGPALAWAIISIGAASVGGYLLWDADIKGYRESLKTKKAV